MRSFDILDNVAASLPNKELTRHIKILPTPPKNKFISTANIKSLS